MRIEQRSRMCLLTIPDIIQIEMSNICKIRNIEFKYKLFPNILN